jgi:lipopolysaccharide/colanic/teichoic acid biosynthesis glycosyltransferase
MPHRNIEMGSRMRATGIIEPGPQKADLGCERRAISHTTEEGIRDYQLIAKRALDILVSGSSLIILLPLFLMIAVLIKIESRGPVLFTQQRWGMGGKKIRVYKFRSMQTNLCDPTGIQQTVPNDPRITPFGSFLRKSNFDELPQLLNVLKGDMSLVGPRCHAIGMKAAGVQYEELVPAYHERHRMRPGITGLAQMRGLRGPTVSPSKSKARIACDIHYVNNFSLLLDVKIAFGTLRHEMFRGTGF